ncbi:MAG: mandelate racemase/muconate lactonizing enzyme family protein [Betaproteobacteria bacterium]|nr:mandelate racemase/muconate lactonizing enzyme family protein [Betaproteobacteria bacterium]
MKVRKLTCWLLRIPFHFPLVKEEQHAMANFVEVETEDGLKGHSLSTYPMRFGIREFINREAAPVIEGMDALRPEEIRNKLFWATARKYFHGAWNCAASLIDIALWDVKGKALGQPIWKLLGGAHATLPAYITFGLPRYSIDQLIEVAKMLIGDGQTSLKMVVAKGTNPFDEILGQPTDADILEDARRVAALREAVGPKIEIMMDANKGATYTQALRLAKLCEPYHLTWFEDPVLQADPRLMAKLRTQTTIPIASGSTATSDLMYMREYLVREAVDYLQPNVRDIGGYTQGLKAAAMAQAFNVPLAMGGNYPHMNMHLHGGVPNGGRVEFHWQGWKCVEALFDGAPGPVNGTVTLPEAPGLGFTPRSGILDLAVD